MSSSSELSSSEINQSQGFYHDGNNELPDMSALPEPLAPSQISLAPDETLWRKYSSHYEFPLSMLLALGIHVFAILFILAYMTISFYFKVPAPIVGTAIVPSGNTDLKGENPLAGGDLIGSSTDPSQKEFKDWDIDLGLKTPPTEAPPPSSIPLPNRQIFDDQTNTILKGKNGISPDDGSGPGKGKLTEPGTASSGPSDGPKRWTISMRYDSPETFIEKLADLRIVVAARKLNGRFLLFDALSTQKPNTYRELTSEQVSAEIKKMKRSFYTSTGRVSCENFALGMNMSEAPAALYLFIPRDLEEALLQAELKQHKMTVEQIKQKKIVTTFDVKRTETGWEVKVTGSRVDPNLKY